MSAFLRKRVVSSSFKDHTQSRMLAEMELALALGLPRPTIESKERAGAEKERKLQSLII